MSIDIAGKSKFTVFGMVGIVNFTLVFIIFQIDQSSQKD